MDSLFSMSQTSVEQRLDKLIRDFQQGKRAPSVVSLQTVDSLDPDDKEAWRTIRKELEDIGISVAAFDANKDFIFEWLSNAVDTGAFQEQAVSSPSGSIHSLDVLSSTSSSSSPGVNESNKKTVMSNTEPPKASKAKTKPTGNYTILQTEQAIKGTGAAGGPHAPVIPTKVPRFAALVAFFSAPNYRLLRAVKRIDLGGMKKIVTDPATSHLIDRPALNDALCMAIEANSKEACTLLIDAGAGINDNSHDDRPVTTAVRHGNRDLVAFLLDRGADVNYQSGNNNLFSSALRAAIALEDKVMISFLSQRGADINAVQGGPHCAAGIQIDYLDGKIHIDYPTAIHQASAISSASVVDLLINLGADFHSPQRGLGTPLMLSIYQGRFSTAKLLIKKGANINNIPVPLGDPKRQFRSIVHIAIYASSPDLVKLLLNHGAVTDWHEAYEFAKQCSMLRDRYSRPGFRKKDMKKSSDAGRVLHLIEEQKQKSAGQV